MSNTDGPYVVTVAPTGDADGDGEAFAMALHGDEVERVLAKLSEFVVSVDYSAADEDDPRIADALERIRAMREEVAADGE